jgi:pimeloyl-ACP methyl ester carboxylesterase
MSNLKNIMVMKLLIMFHFILYVFLIAGQETSNSEVHLNDTLSFKVTTYDGLQLPAQIIFPAEGTSNKIIIFINGSTPGDERGNIAPVCNSKGQVILQKQDFYIRFLDFMPAKGYCTVSMAKRSFVEPLKIPRPTLDELALDVAFLIEHLKSNNIFTPEKKLFLVGYSEGSVVASKVLGWLKQQPDACILLGSGSNAFDFHNKSWHDWPLAEIYRKTKNWNDEQIQMEFDKWKDITNQIQQMDEFAFETEFKNSRPHGVGFAQWESYHIDKEMNNYYPEANIIDANIPLLICIGENDTAMPEARAAQTYKNLLDKGFSKATYKVIPGEVHQYRKFDVFGIIDSWIHSDFNSTEFKISQPELKKMEQYAQETTLKSEFDSLPYEGSPQKVLNWFAKVKGLPGLEINTWFSLGVKLAGNRCLEEAHYAFSKANCDGHMIQSGAMVWLGHLSDAEGNRNLAMQFYEQALETYPGFPVQHDLWNIHLSEEWIRERLEIPFSLDMLNPK